MTRMLSSVALAILLVISIPAQRRRPPQKPQQPAAEEKKPSLKETFDFLKEKIIANGFYKSTTGAASEGQLISTYRVEDVQFDGCVLTLKTVNTKVFTPDPIVDTTNTMQKVTLTDLDVKQIAVEPHGSGFAVSMRTIENRKAVHAHWEEKGHNMFTGMPRNTVEDMDLSAIGIYFTDKDIATRIANAFVYAVGLCTAKKEPF